MLSESVLHSPKKAKKRHRDEDSEEPVRKKKQNSSNQDNQKLCGNDLETTLDKSNADETLENLTDVINMDTEQQCMSIKKKKKKKRKKNVDKDSHVFESTVEICDSSKSKKHKNNSEVECASNTRVIARDSRSSEQNIVTSTTDDYREPASSIDRERRKDLRSASQRNRRVRENDCEDDEEADRTDEFRTAKNSHPSSTKSNVQQEAKRLAEFKQYNKVSFKAWHKICDNLKKEGMLAYLRVPVVVES